MSPSVKKSAAFIEPGHKAAAPLPSLPPRRYREKEAAATDLPRTDRKPRTDPATNTVSRPSTATYTSQAVTTAETDTKVAESSPADQTETETETASVAETDDRCASAPPQAQTDHQEPNEGQRNTKPALGSQRGAAQAGPAHPDSRVRSWLRQLGISAAKSEQESVRAHHELLGSDGTSLSGSNSLATKLAGLHDDLLSLNDLSPHRDEPQVKLDIKRSFTLMSHFNSFNSVTNSSYTTILSQDDIRALRRRLFCLIVRVLRKYPALNYYQGYHDVASVILLVCNEPGETSDDDAFLLLENLTLFHLRDFMISDIALTINHLKLIPLILEVADPVMFDLVVQTNAAYNATGGCFYDYKFHPALSSILTLYSHDISNMNQLVVVWDFIFSYRSVLASIYIYVAALMQRKPDILLELGIDELSTAPVDADAAHSLLSPTSLFCDLSDSALTEIIDTAASLIDSCALERHPRYQATFGVWFETYNTDSVLQTSSRIAKECPETMSKATTYSSQEILDLVSAQELQQRQESAYDAEMMQKAFDKMDSLSNSIDSTFDDSPGSRSSVFSSSLASLTNASSYLNNTLVQTSSALLKRMPGAHEDNDSDTKKRAIIPFRNIYQLSVTVGVIGLGLHLLLKHSEFGFLFKLTSKNMVSAVKHNAMVSTNYILSALAHNGEGAVSKIREFGPVRDISEITQIGLGFLKKSVYALN